MSEYYIGGGGVSREKGDYVIHARPLTENLNLKGRAVPAKSATFFKPNIKCFWFRNIVCSVLLALLVYFYPFLVHF